MKKSVLITVIGVIALAALITGGFYLARSDNNDPGDSATNEEEVSFEEQEGATMENFEPVANVEELTIIDLREGDGETVMEGATITANYTGALASNGVIFQSSRDFGGAIEFSLQQVITGWAQGVPGMKVGGERRLLIPAELAYGENPPPGSNIPPNADLVFDIEVIEIN